MLNKLNYDEKELVWSLVLYHCTVITGDITMISANNDNSAVSILICQYDFDSITILNTIWNRVSIAQNGHIYRVYDNNYFSWFRASKLYSFDYIWYLVHKVCYTMLHVICHTICNHSITSTQRTQPSKF